jgi:hypothetical protein
MHGEVDLVVMEAGVMEWDLLDMVVVVMGKFSVIRLNNYIFKYFSGWGGGNDTSVVNN